jgi:hypothetical protein
MAYLAANWNQTDLDVGWKSADNVSNYQATFTVTKSLVVLQIETVNGRDWYDDFAIAIVNRQNSNGSWPAVGAWEGADTTGVLSTVFALLTLMKAAAVWQGRQSPFVLLFLLLIVIVASAAGAAAASKYRRRKVCYLCGRKLEDDARLCDRCSAVQPT